LLGKRKEKKKTQTINHLWQSNHDMSTSVALCREGTTVHLVIQQMSIFDHREVSHAPSYWRRRCPLIGLVKHAPTAF